MYAGDASQARNSVGVTGVTISAHARVGDRAPLTRRVWGLALCVALLQVALYWAASIAPLQNPGTVLCAAASASNAPDKCPPGGHRLCSMVACNATGTALLEVRAAFVSTPRFGEEKFALPPSNEPRHASASASFFSARGPPTLA